MVEVGEEAVVAAVTTVDVAAVDVVAVAEVTAEEGIIINQLVATILPGAANRQVTNAV